MVAIGTILLAYGGKNRVSYLLRDGDCFYTLQSKNETPIQITNPLITEEIRSGIDQGIFKKAPGNNFIFYELFETPKEIESLTC